MATREQFMRRAAASKMSVMHKRKMSRVLAGVFSGLVVASLAAQIGAQDASDPLQACHQMTDAAARLACFDSEMQRRDALAAPTHGAAAATRKPADDTVGLEG